MIFKVGILILCETKRNLYDSGAKYKLERRG